MQTSEKHSQKCFCSVFFYTDFDFFRNPHCKLFNGGDSESGRLLIKDRVIWLSFRFRFIGGQLR